MTCARRAAFGLVFLAALSSASSASQRTAIVGESAPDFEASTLDGRKLTAIDFRDDVLILDFWASWSAPSRKDLALLDEYYRIQEKAGLRILAVAIDNSISLNRLKGVAAALAVSLVRRFKGSYGPLNGVPTHYVIDRLGVLRYAKAGAWTLDDLNEILVPLLRSQPPSEIESGRPRNARLLPAAASRAFPSPAMPAPDRRSDPQVLPARY